MTTVRSVLWVRIIAAATVVLLTFTAARLSLHRPISADEAYNLQIAKSIGTHFCYCTRYVPERVFPTEESTNGVMQYVGGFFFAVSGNPDVAKTGTVALGMLLLGAALFVLEPWLVFFAGFLFFVWPWFHVCATGFLGETWAVAFLLFGIAALRRRAIVPAILCFGVAVESKLIAILTLPLAWPVFFAEQHDSPMPERAWYATSRSAVVFAGTVLVLFALIAFSVIHSMRSVDVLAIWRTFSGFIGSMVGQGQGHAGQGIPALDTPLIAVLFAMACVLLLVANVGYAFFVAATLVWWMYFGASERHLVVPFFVLMMMAGVEARGLVERVVKRRSDRLAAPAWLAPVLAAVAVVFMFSAGGVYGVRLRRFPDRAHVLSTSNGHWIYSRKLVSVLRSYPYVLTSGWWQFPELSLRENMEFYDRTSPANANLPRQGAVLFFDRGNTLSPFTSVRANCARVLYTEGPLVVCAPKPNLALALQPGTAAP